MELDPSTLAVGQTARGRLVVHEAAGAPDPRWDATEGLDIHPGGRENRTSITQGQMRRERVFHFTVTARREGVYSLAPRDYRIGGTPVPIAPVTVRVVPRDALPDPGESVFARVEIERPSFFVQESFPVVLALYYRDVELHPEVQLEGLETAGIEWGRFQELAGGRERVGDRLYQVRRFRSRARALAVGRHRIGPVLHVQQQVRRPGHRGSPFAFDEFFGRAERRPLQVPVAPAQVEVLPLPEEDRPAGFSGAVGRFFFDVELDRNTVTVGEPVAVRIIVHGEGNPDLVRAPEIDPGDAFRPYEPRLVERDFDPARSLGRKVFETVLVPRSTEAAEIPALSFSFFDPVEARYRTLQRGPFPLEIKPAREDAAPVAWLGTGAIAPPDDPAPGRGLRYLKPAPRSWRRADDQRGTARALRIGMDLAPLVAAAILAAAGRRRERMTRDPGYVRRTRAPRVARRALRDAAQACAGNDMHTLADRLWDALAAYFGGRLNLPPGEVTSARILDAAEGAGMTGDPAERLHALLARIEDLRFGGGSRETQTGAALLDATHRVMRESERATW